MSARDALMALSEEEMRPQINKNQPWIPQGKRDDPDFAASPADIVGTVVDWYEFEHTQRKDDGSEVTSTVKAMLVDDGTTDEEGEPLPWSIAGFQKVLKDILDSYDLDDLVEHGVTARWHFGGVKKKSEKAQAKGLGKTFLEFSFRAAWDNPDGETVWLETPRSGELVRWDDEEAHFELVKKSRLGADASPPASAPLDPGYATAAPTNGQPAPASALPSSLVAHARQAPETPPTPEVNPADLAPVNEAAKARLIDAGTEVMTAHPKLKDAYRANLVSAQNPGGLNRLNAIQTQGQFDQVAEFLTDEMLGEPDQAQAWLKWAAANPADGVDDPVTYWLKMQQPTEPAADLDPDSEPF